MAGNALPKLGDEWIESQDFGIPVDGAHQIGGGDNGDLAVEHVQGIDGKLAFGAA